ncbi:MAG: hypothetical protein KAJ42_18625, partial [Gemmatimonadetes bacterium]|nr:hypothetical protein [Gemmatimonadota bacterium]
MIPEPTDETREFRAPKTLNPEELGDTLAQLVWESFSDFIADGDADTLLGELGLTTDDGVPKEAAAEEMLIFLMWAHTRGMQLAFVGRATDDLIKEGLDELHKAVFEDMVNHGTPRSQLPIFEQRVSARYMEYYSASGQSDTSVGAAVVGHLTGRADQSAP